MDQVDEVWTLDRVPSDAGEELFPWRISVPCLRKVYRSDHCDDGGCLSVLVLSAPGQCIFGMLRNHVPGLADTEGRDQKLYKCEKIIYRTHRRVWGCNASASAVLFCSPFTLESCCFFQKRL